MTRMWMVEPRWMCRQHLLGEHKEIHQLVGSIKKGRSIEGHLKKRQVEPANTFPRHEQLVKEMERRGYKHNSPFPNDFSVPMKCVVDPIAFVDKDKSLQDLMSRCSNCMWRYLELEVT